MIRVVHFELIFRLVRFGLMFRFVRLGLSRFTSKRITSQVSKIFIRKSQRNLHWSKVCWMLIQIRFPRLCPCYRHFIWGHINFVFLIMIFKTPVTGRCQKVFKNQFDDSRFVWIFSSCSFSLLTLPFRVYVWWKRNYAVLITNCLLGVF